MESTTLGLPHPIRSAYRFSQPPSGLLLHSPRSLISCFIRLRGFTLQRLPLSSSTSNSSSLVPLTALAALPSSVNQSRPPASVDTRGCLAPRVLTHSGVRSQSARCYPKRTAAPLLSFLYLLGNITSLLRLLRVSSRVIIRCHPKATASLTSEY